MFFGGEVGGEQSKFVTYKSVSAGNHHESLLAGHDIIDSVGDFLQGLFRVRDILVGPAGRLAAILAGTE